MQLPSPPLKKQVDGFFSNLKEQLGGVVVVVSTPWIVFVFDVLASIFAFDFRDWFALRPRSLMGVQGILTMPLVHADFWHLAYNTWGLVMALMLLAVLRPQSWFRVLVAIYLASGILTWLFASGSIVGASGVVLGLVCFLVAPGVLLIGWWAYKALSGSSRPSPLQVHPIPLVVSLLIGVFYLQNLFFNLIPIPGLNTGNRTSWAAHWCGALAGFLVAFAFYKAEGSVATEPRKRVARESLL